MKALLSLALLTLSHLPATAQSVTWTLENEESVQSALTSFSKTLSKQTVWMDRGKSKLLDAGFAGFEDWRDEMLEQEEIDRHKLSRKIVREEHWIVHGVSGRRKRNMRRVRELADLRKTKATERKVAGGVTLTMAEGEASGKPRYEVSCGRCVIKGKSALHKQIFSNRSAYIHSALG